MLKIIAAIFSVFVLVVSCNDPKNEIEPETQEKTNQATLTAFLDKVWNEKDLDAIDTYFSENLIRQVNGVKLASRRNELKANMQLYFTGFPDFKLDLDHMIDESN